jgi:ribosome-binding protein aMBF1 (putative translation factor)
MATEIVGVQQKRCYVGLMLSPEQSRAARGWLDWSQETLARHANVSLSTVRDFEKGRREPIANNKAAMERALQGAGIETVLDKHGNPIGIERRHANGAVSVSDAKDTEAA